MARWTADSIPDQSGRVVVVTGANSGIGLVTAREPARAGARVIMGVRDTVRGERAAQSARTAAPAAEIETMELDLADLASVRSFTEAFAQRHEGPDVLINNAGVMALPHRHTADGFEMQFGTNHLGHFALTGRLLPGLIWRPEPRVVTVSSVAHKRGRINLDDLQGEQRYRRRTAYAQSKLANLMFALELARRAGAAGLSLRSVAAHPGYAATNLQFAGPRMEGSKTGEKLMAVASQIAQSAERGALPSLYAATVPVLPSGSYVGPDGPMEIWGFPRLVGTSARARDRETARRLWEVSEELTGVHYDFAALAAAR